MWEEGHVMLGFDAEERLIQKLPHDFAAKVIWGSRYPHQASIMASATPFCFRMSQNHLTIEIIRRSRA